MPYEDSRARPEAAHHIILEDRERLSVSGVEEVESFDENTIVMSTTRAHWSSGEKTCTSKSSAWTAVT